MRLIKITGGLGNQMFIYAFYMQMKKRFTHVYIDLTDMMHYNVHNGYEMHRVFGLPRVEVCMNQPLKKTVEFLFFKTILERKQHGSMRPYTRRYIWPLVYFKGFFQSEKYFADIRDEVRQAFTFNLKQANEQTLHMLGRIDKDQSAVSLHVRRGDYLLPQHWKSLGGICDLSYYRNAVQMIKSRVDNPHFYVFSDDMDWVRKNLDLPGATYIDWNSGADSWQDMMLMSRCRHNIICNSTFSWWGGWLNPHEYKMVLAPEKWFRNAETPDIYPESWIRIAIV